MAPKRRKEKEYYEDEFYEKGINYDPYDREVHVVSNADDYHSLHNRVYRFLHNYSDAYIIIGVDNAVLICKRVKIILHKVINPDGMMPNMIDKENDVYMPFILYWDEPFVSFESKMRERIPGLTHRIQYDRHKKIRLYEHSDIENEIKNLSY